MAREPTPAWPDQDAFWPGGAPSPWPGGSEGGGPLPAPAPDKEPDDASD
jgi:hypothetical protein